MADRPILFSAPMIRALLDGRKTQTRRVLKPQPTMHDAGDCTIGGHRGPVDYLMREIYPKHMARFRKGDRLWVREAFCNDPVQWHSGPTSLVHRADFRENSDTKSIMQRHGVRWRPGIHMPRWASRLTLTVTDVRVQRLQEISEADAIAEGVKPRTVEFNDGTSRALWFGVPHVGNDGPIRAYGDLWDAINNPRGLCADDAPNGWEANPWIVALTFTVERRNIDTARAA